MSWSDYFNCCLILIRGSWFFFPNQLACVNNIVPMFRLVCKYKKKKGSDRFHERGLIKTQCSDLKSYNRDFCTLSLLKKWAKHLFFKIKPQFLNPVLVVENKIAYDAMVFSPVCILRSIWDNPPFVCMCVSTLFRFFFFTLTCERNTVP